MMRLQRLAMSLCLWRWPMALSMALRGVRVHPSTVLYGFRKQIRLGRGTSIGARNHIDLGRRGRLVAGEHVWLSSDVEIQTDTEVKIGAGTTVQRRSTINGSVKIGRGCILAPNVFVSSGTHPFRIVPHLPIRAQELLIEREGVDLDRPVWIQDDCWLGVNSVVCPGVTVSKGSVIGANAVVTRDVPPYSVVAGSPARAIGHRLDWQPKAVVDASVVADAPYVLSGRFPHSDPSGAAAIVVTADEPLCVALALRDPTNQSIRVIYSAATATHVLACGNRYTLQGEFAELFVPQQKLNTDDANVALCEIAIVDASKASLIKIHRIEIVGA